MEQDLEMRMIFTLEELLENQRAIAWEVQIPDVIKGRAMRATVRSFVLTRSTVETH